MAMQAALADIQEARRNALVDYYIAHCVPDTPIDGGVPLSKRVKTPDDLYEYLLIDTQITATVTTARVAEAISSVQLYVNRCLGGYDPDVDNAPGSTMVRQSRPGGFLYDWDAYNQVYSTWAGKERLQYYPSVYLDPSLRYNKTELFNALEETINQGRISSTRVDAGFQQYMLGFETLANLETISGYQAGYGAAASADCRDTLYFIGRTSTAPYSYYWRTCNMAIRDDAGNITGGAWSQWLKVEAPTSEALNDYLSPCWANGRLYVCWLTRTEVGATGGETNTKPLYQYYVNIWVRRNDGGWEAVSKVPCSASGEILRALAVANERGDEVSLYVSTTAGQFTYRNATWQYYESPLPPSNMVFSNYTMQSGKELNTGLVGVKVDLPSPSGEYFLQINEITPKEIIAYTNSPKIGTYFIDDTGYYFAGSTHIGPGIAIGFREELVKISFQYMDGGNYKWPETQFYDIYLYKTEKLSNSGFMFNKDALYLSNENWSIALSTDAARNFIKPLDLGIANLLSYEVQTALIEQGGTQPIDFNGAYGLYFWEIFFHSSFLIADRYLNEQNYADAAQWYRYIFAATGYRNDQGELETIDG
ncbi:neuraminidase-like domain-containing protein, partial [Pseudomonas resinovorans]